MAESTSMEIQLVIASINNEDQNTQKEANIIGGNEEENDELVIDGPSQTTCIVQSHDQGRMTPLGSSSQ